MVTWAPHKRFGHPIMMECVELCMEFKQTYINYEHLSYTAAYKHPKLQYRHDMHNCNIFRCAYQIDSYMCLSVHKYAYKVSKYDKQYIYIVVRKLYLNMHKYVYIWSSFAKVYIKICFC